MTLQIGWRHGAANWQSLGASRFSSSPKWGRGARSLDAIERSRALAVDAGQHAAGRAVPRERTGAGPAAGGRRAVGYDDAVAFAVVRRSAPSDAERARLAVRLGRARADGHAVLGLRVTGRSGGTARFRRIAPGACATHAAAVVVIAGLDLAGGSWRAVAREATADESAEGRRLRRAATEACEERERECSGVLPHGPRVALRIVAGNDSSPPSSDAEANRWFGTMATQHFVDVGPLTIDLNKTFVKNSPPDVATWAETTKITKFDLNLDGVYIEFSKRDGSGSWPDVPFGAPGDSLEYSLWIVLDIGGTWYTSGCIQYWRGLDRNGGPPSGYAANWYYDANRWGPMTGHQPAVGEQVGFFVTAGNARNVTDQSGSLVYERSNVITIPFASAGSMNGCGGCGRMM